MEGKEALREFFRLAFLLLFEIVLEEPYRAVGSIGDALLEEGEGGFALPETFEGFFRISQDNVEDEEGEAVLVGVESLLRDLVVDPFHRHLAGGISLEEPWIMVCLLQKGAVIMPYLLDAGKLLGGKEPRFLEAEDVFYRLQDGPVSRQPLFDEKG